MTIVSTHQLAVSRNGTPILVVDDLEIGCGERVRIGGGNGSGKTTMPERTRLSRDWSRRGSPW